jgi:hypothetical protein
MEGKVWAGHADHIGGEAVQQICDSVEPFYPIALMVQPNCVKI